MAVTFNLGKKRTLGYWKALALITSVVSALGLYYAFNPPDYRVYTFESQTLDGRRLTIRYPEGWELHHGQKEIVSLERKRVSFLQSLIEQFVFKITPADEANCRMELNVLVGDVNGLEKLKSVSFMKSFTLMGAKFEVETSEFQNPLGEGYVESEPTPVKNPLNYKYAYSTSRYLLIKSVNGDRGTLLKATYRSPLSLKTRMDTLAKDILDHIQVTPIEQ